MNCRFAVAASLLALCAVALPARAQDQDPVVVDIEGDCLLTLGGRPVPCAGVAYMLFPQTGRIDFTAVTARAGWAFSGQTDQNHGDRYSLLVDSMVSPSSGRVLAQGRCDMDLAQDRVTVNLVQCQARTPAGLITLKASGMASADGDGEADDADDGPGVT